MKARKGFTLVELLIVIAIIGTLVGAMMLSGGSATDAAQTAALLSELRALKGAVSRYYVNYNSNPTQIADLTMYMDNKAKTVGYVVEAVPAANVTEVGEVVVGYGGVRLTPGVKEKLAGKATQTGVLGSHAQTDPYKGEATVYMVAR
jgi:prepilin-type N-terminal cleavage/methylation domain-containing protein